MPLACQFSLKLLLNKRYIFHILICYSIVTHQIKLYKDSQLWWLTPTISGLERQGHQRLSHV